MSLFSLAIMSNSQSLVVYLKKYRRLLEILTPPKLDNNILGVITQSFN